ncbi:hypothetical protein PR048_032552 [Dryococelus australis]|uniref:Dipeptidase n=1 Tax=Dryococelus australis TaxID=614101 RepID=A0ABQ9G2I4_9NEOP|nr:hypothetical protein PR048_032552 [Dryococelus australis]
MCEETANSLVYLPPAICVVVSSVYQGNCTSGSGLRPLPTDCLQLRNSTLRGPRIFTATEDKVDDNELPEPRKMARADLSLTKVHVKRRAEDCLPRKHREHSQFVRFAHYQVCILEEPLLHPPPECVVIGLSPSPYPTRVVLRLTVTPSLEVCCDWLVLPLLSPEVVEHSRLIGEGKAGVFFLPPLLRRHQPAGGPIMHRGSGTTLLCWLTDRANPSAPHSSARKKTPMLANGADFVSLCSHEAEDYPGSRTLAGLQKRLDVAVNGLYGSHSCSVSTHCTGKTMETGKSQGISCDRENAVKCQGILACIRENAINGGIVMVSFFNHFLSCSDTATLHDVIANEVRSNVNETRATASVIFLRVRPTTEHAPCYTRLSSQQGAAVVKWLDCSPTANANRVSIGIVPDDATRQRVFSGISRFTPPPPRPFIPTLLHTQPLIHSHRLSKTSISSPAWKFHTAHVFKFDVSLDLATLFPRKYSPIITDLAYLDECYFITECNTTQSNRIVFVSEGFRQFKAQCQDDQQVADFVVSFVCMRRRNILEVELQQGFGWFSRLEQSYRHTDARQGLPFILCIDGGRGKTNDLLFCFLVAAHINHIRSVAGVNHVGLGAGYDGINLNEVRMKQRRNVRCVWKPGDRRENWPTSGMVQHDSCMRISGGDPAGNRTRFAWWGCSPQDGSSSVVACCSTPAGLEDVSRYPLLLAELARDRHWSSSDIKKLAGANLVRVFREVEKVSAGECKQRRVVPSNKRFHAGDNRSLASTPLQLQPCAQLAGPVDVDVSETRRQNQHVPTTLASHQGEQGSIPGRVTGFSQVGIVTDDAVGRRVFSGISRFPRPFIPAPLHENIFDGVVSSGARGVGVCGADGRLDLDGGPGRQDVLPLPGHLSRRRQVGSPTRGQRGDRTSLPPLTDRWRPLTRRS